MNQPKKLHPLIDYSADIFIPEIDIDLTEFISFHNEHLDSHNAHEKLKELGIDHVGESVFVSEDAIDEHQFEIDDNSYQSSDPQNKSDVSNLIN